MKLRKEKILLDVLLGTGLFLLDSVRNRLAENASDLADRAQDVYETASGRVRRASDVIRGEDHRVMSTATAVLLGLGIGVGVGMLLAPASGEETCSNLAEKVRERFRPEREGATGTYGG